MASKVPLAYPFGLSTGSCPLRLPMTVPADPKIFDHDLALRSCALGDQQALQNIYVHDSRRLLGIALRIVRQCQLAEDVVRDAFVHIWNKAASFDARRGTGRGWIYSFVSHQALNMVRQRESDVYVDADAVDAFLEKNGEAVGDRSVAELFEFNASMGRLLTCLAQLGSATRWPVGSLLSLRCAALSTTGRSVCCC